MIEICKLSEDPPLVLCRDEPNGWAMCEGFSKSSGGRPPSPKRPTYFGYNLENCLNYAVKLLSFRKTATATNLKEIIAIQQETWKDIKRVAEIKELHKLAEACGRRKDSRKVIPAGKKKKSRKSQTAPE